MPDAMGNLDRLPELLREPARTYARMVQQAAGADAVALTFYGRVAGGEFDPAAHVARNVLVVARIDLAALRGLAGQAARLARAAIDAPVVMTPEHITRSLDTFPLELIEIQQRNVRVFGPDLFGSLSFAEEHVRMQCERELKAALVGMHRGLLGSRDRERELHAVVAAAAEGLLRVLGGMLWLKGRRAALPAADTVAEVETLAGRKLPGIRRALAAGPRHGWDAFEMVYDDITALGKTVDAW